MRFEYQSVHCQLQARYDNVGNLTKEMDKLLNGMARDGWEYVNVAPMPAHINAGCLGFLSGKRDADFDVQLVIFRRPVGAPPPLPTSRHGQ